MFALLLHFLLSSTLAETRLCFQNTVLKPQAKRVIQRVGKAHCCVFFQLLVSSEEFYHTPFNPFLTCTKVNKSLLVFIPPRCCLHLVLLTEVHTEDLGVAQGPFDPVEGSSGGRSLLSGGVLHRRRGRMRAAGGRCRIQKRVTQNGVVEEIKVVKATLQIISPFYCLLGK